MRQTLIKGHHGWLPLLLLTVAGFTFNTSELMPIGLLSDIAADFRITEARAGLLITVYAWFVALLSLPLTLYFANSDFRKLMLGIVALFVVSHIGSTFATGYYSLMLSRIGVASAHAIFWSIAPTMAVAVAGKIGRATALSVMVAGGGIALVAGLPLGRVLGLSAGWRMTFAALGLLALIVFIGLKITLPPLPQEDDGESRSTILKHIIGCRPLLMIYLITAVIVTGHYTGYSYVEPFLDKVAHMDPTSITLTLCLFGVAGLIGSLVMARFFSVYPRQIIFAACFTLPVTLFLLLPVSWTSPWLLVALCIIWGLGITIFNIAFQNEIIIFSPHHSAVAMSIYSGIFNLGIGMGALVGGLVVDHCIIDYIGLTGGTIALSAALYMYFRFLPLVKIK